MVEAITVVAEPEPSLPKGAETTDIAATDNASAAAKLPNEIERPRMLSEIDRRFPPPPQRSRRKLVRLLLTVDAAGTVSEVKLKEGQLGPEEFALLAERFKTARFSPAKSGSESVESQVEIEVSLDPVAASLTGED